MVHDTRVMTANDTSTTELVFDGIGWVYGPHESLMGHVTTTAAMCVYRIVDTVREADFTRRENYKERVVKRPHFNTHVVASSGGRGHHGGGHHCSSVKLVVAAMPTYKEGQSSCTSHGSGQLTPSCYQPSSRGCHSGASCSSQPPTSRRGCFECSDLGHFKTDYLMHMHGGQSQGSGLMAVRQPTRGGSRGTRSGSQAAGVGVRQVEVVDVGVTRLRVIVVISMLF
ncbi:hypothetical protein K7X08_035907 [Anisodus acutangulus]|uniref:Uncharacterized protein n=1 Tax=Anisodus acutangulus TaxID=402998 RepID=A0A9Q1L7B1_9SOLA|nr:hypothetical protein K7X08_035907 [Anisodus acutangulus]